MVKTIRGRMYSRVEYKEKKKKNEKPASESVNGIKKRKRNTPQMR